MPNYILNKRFPVFPNPEHSDDEGLVAIGGNLSPDTLLTAYKLGIFPWYNDNIPLWWCPDPRCVLFPSELKVSKSMRSLMAKNVFRITMNTQFNDVILLCGHVPRKGQSGTWLNDDLIHSFQQLHLQGFAHSVEVWDRNDSLVGGLYGLWLDSIFFGESMFSIVPNASKYALITFVETLKKRGVKMIDCQQDTPHLRSLGARNIPRAEFIEFLKGEFGG